MNDPHVVALSYRVNKSTLEGYTGEVPLDHECDRFRITLDGSRVRFEVKDQFATEAAAREVVDEFIAQWRLYAGVVGPYRDFRLRFEESEMEDRSPESNAVAIHAVGRTRASGTAKLIVRHSALPSPPTGLRFTPDVESMALRYRGHLNGREPLPSMAYFCLNVLEASVPMGSPKGRRGACKKYRVSRGVLRKIGCLTSERGGREARKASGTQSELSPQEETFLLEAVRRLILRAAEVAYDPNAAYPTITLRDLPPSDAAPHP